MISLTGKYFVTGTDTDSGKTFVTCKLLNTARQLGRQVIGLKPVASGVENGVNSDAMNLLEASSPPLNLKDINPICFDEPIAPHIAAEKQNITLTAEQLVKGIQPKLNDDKYDLCLVEGAGGWRVPINYQQTWRDVVQQLDIAVILVIGMRLGCLNHALLTEQSILADNCVIEGWIANQIDPAMGCYQENLETLRKMMRSSFMGEITFDIPVTI